MNTKEALARAAKYLIVSDLTRGFKDTIELSVDIVREENEGNEEKVIAWILVLLEGNREEREPILYYLECLGIAIDIVATIE